MFLVYFPMIDDSLESHSIQKPAEIRINGLCFLMAGVISRILSYLTAPLSVPTFINLILSHLNSIHSHICRIQPFTSFVIVSDSTSWVKQNGTVTSRHCENDVYMNYHYPSEASFVILTSGASRGKPRVFASHRLCYCTLRRLSEKMAYMSPSNSLYTKN